MVKRPKSPELAEDARYFTVYQPYPINANWILEEEQKKCSMWVAECIGLNYLWAIHYKPKARGMILLEVSKDFTDHGRLLGEHRWGDILKDPDEIEKKSVTQVFHCFYSKLRDCQKDGWKAIPIQNSWFKGWTPGQGDVKRPYPPTHWCPVPAEDRTNKTLCRPLPSEAKPPPPLRAQQRVVGSSKWVGEKQIDAPPTPYAMSNAWAKKTPPLDTRGTKSPSPSVKSPQSAGPTTTSASESKLPPAKNPRAKPVPLNAFISGETKTGKGGWGKLPAANKFAVTDPVPKGPVNAWSKKLNIPPSEKSPKAPTSPSPYEMDYSAWTVPPEPTPPLPESPAARESSRIPEEPPPPKPNKGKGKEKDKGKQPAWKRNAQQPEEKPTEEPVYSLADIANRKPPTRAEVDATLQPWERGKVDYAKLGVVDAEPKPSTDLDWKMDPPTNDWNKPVNEGRASGLDWKMDPPTNDWNKPLDEASSSNLDWKMDPPTNDWNKPLDEGSSNSWKMDPPTNDWNKPFVEGSTSNDTSFSSSLSYDKKRKPDGQFNKDGEPQYDRYGEPSNRYDSRKRATYGSSEYSNRTYGGGSSSPDRGRGRVVGRGGYRGKPNAWDARRDAPGPRYKEVGVKWYPGRKDGDSEANTQAGEEVKPDTFKRPSYHGEPNRGEHPIKNTDGNDTKDTFKYPSYYEKPIGTSWGDTPITNKVEPAGEFKYPDYYEKPIGTSWGDLPISSTDDLESKDWADENMEGEAQEGEWNKGEAEEGDPNEEPPNSDLGEEGYEDGGEYDEHDYQPESTEGEPTSSSTNWGSGPAEVRGSNDWGLAPGEPKVNSWGFPEPEETSSADNPWASKPTTDASAWFADGVIPAHIQDWEKILEESLQPKRPQPEELVCPTHNIACKKGICRDMAKLVRERDMAQWMRTRGRGRGRPNGGRGWGDPRGPRGSWGAKELPDDEVVTYKRTRRGNKKNKPKASIGVMRGFEDGTAASADGTAASEVGAGGHDGDDTGSDGGHLD